MTSCYYSHRRRRRGVSRYGRGDKRTDEEGGLRCFIFSREGSSEFGERRNVGRNAGRVVTETYSVDIRNDVVHARKRARRLGRRVRRTPATYRRASDVHHLARACSSASLRRSDTTRRWRTTPSGHYRNKCGRLHNTTTSNSGRFDGARYRPLAKDIQWERPASS